MQKYRSLILSVALLSIIALVAVGCGGSDQTPAPEGDKNANEKAPAQEEKAPAPAEATYVGDDGCTSCHSEASKGFHGTQHAGALKPVTDFQLNGELPKVKLFDGGDAENKTPTEVDLATANIYGVMMDHYVLGEVPGFKGTVYRVAALEKNGDKYDVVAAKSVDVDEDGTKDWQAAESSRCVTCHAPGVASSSPTLGISCESCHGPGSNHVAAGPGEKKGSFEVKASTETCLACHDSKPSKSDDGTFTAQNHYGTRNWFASEHAKSSQLTGCMACHSTHKANAKGQLLPKDSAADVCATCHGSDIDVEKLMWKNPTDPHHHIVKDHSFGAMTYEELGDDSETDATEITNPAYLEVIVDEYPDLGK